MIMHFQGGVQMSNLKKKKIDVYLNKMISTYERIYKIGLETDGALANPDQYFGKVQALKEFQAHMNSGEFYKKD
jgi:hypothetical protein